MAAPFPRSLAARSLLGTADSLAPRQCLQQARRAAPSSRRYLTSEERAEALADEQKKLRRWLSDRGERYKRPIGQPNYMVLRPTAPQDVPFPDNPMFRSQPVLSEEAKELIWNEVKAGQPIKAVSAKFGVDIRRVAAVVRLREVQENMVAEGKKTANAYADAIMKMLPQTTLKQNEEGLMIPHESINDVHVHSWTQQQIFLPVSESRQFTREDAAKAFNERLLPADKRVAHPELIEYERSIRAGNNPQEAFEEYTKVVKDKQDAAAARDAERRQREEAKTKTVTTGRFEFRFKQVRVDDVGRTGRAREGTGWRYGAPFTDRKRGTVRIPTSVE